MDAPTSENSPIQHGVPVAPAEPVLPQTLPPLPPQPLPPSQPPIQSAPAVPPPAPKQFPFVLVGLALLFLLVIGASTGYLFYVGPRMETTKLVKTLNPKLDALKKSTGGVRSVMDNIHQIVTRESILDKPSGLKADGLLLHGEFASIRIDTNILGVTDERKIGVVEPSIKELENRTNIALTNLADTNPNVAGARTVSEDATVKKTRELKDETLKADEYVKKATDDLQKLMVDSFEPPKILSKNTKDAFKESAKIKQQADPYFSESDKIANYYNVLSGVLITMTTKMESFGASIGGAKELLKQVRNEKDISGIQTRLAQTQSFLDQASKDIEEMKKLSAQLDAIPTSDIPMAAQEYHKHNLQVLATVTRYFESIGTIMSGFVSSSQAFYAKAQNHTATQGDLNAFLASLNEGISQGDQADAKFLADFQALAGEETSLTLSFWQNNTLISSGGRVEVEIDAYEKLLKKLEDESTLPLVN